VPNTPFHIVIPNSFGCEEPAFLRTKTDSPALETAGNDNPSLMLRLERIIPCYAESRNADMPN
jgi:hypothetical protein